MPVFRFRSPVFTRLAPFAFALLSLGSGAGEAQAQATIDAAITGSPVIVREWLALEVAEKDGVGGLASVAFTYSGPFTFTAIQRTFRLAWQVDAQDSAGDWIPQQVAGGAMVHHGDPFQISRSSVSVSAPIPFDVNVPLHAPPTVPTRLRLVLSVERFEGGSWVTVAGPDDGSSGLLIYPFLNTDPQDAARNMWTRMNSFTVARRWALETATNVNMRGFHFTTQAQALRFDAFDMPGTNESVVVRYRFRLFQQGSPEVEIPLMQNTFPRTHSIRTHEGQEPHISTFTGNFYLRPAVQLNSATGFFRVEVEMEHDEVPGGPVRVGGNGLLSNLRLLHFNGTLRFGTLDTVMRAIGGDPATGASHTAAHVQTTLASYTGFLSQNTGHTVDTAIATTLRLFANGTAQVFSVPSSIPVTPPLHARPRAGGRYPFRTRKHPLEYLGGACGPAHPASPGHGNRCV
ncbi:MAG: hypothetical protein JJT96_14680 [Opitutales bacterium]|nr:hypothetical protein [Opitutales bacterium]